MVGSRVVKEAHHRGHTVTAVARSAIRLRSLPTGTIAAPVDARHSGDLVKIFTNQDVIVGAIRSAPGSEGDFRDITRTVLDAAAQTGRRIIIIGGAAPLRVPETANRLVLDDPRYVPKEWRSVAEASVGQLRQCESHQANWTYVSPPALLEPGTRTSLYRRGGFELIVGADGISYISAEDLAVAVLDEIEQSSSTTRHFAVGY
jgi:putative NADH-flavin reductase